MKIVEVCHYFYPHVGGMEKHVLNISEEFVKNGHEVTVICEGESNAVKEEKFGDIRIKRFSYPKIKFLGLIIIWIKLFKYLKDFKEADIVHVHDVFLWYLPFRFFLPSKKQFITFHGWEGVYPIPFKNILLRKIANFLSRGSISIGKYLNKYYSTKSDYYLYGACITPKNTVKKDKNNVLFLGRLSADTGAGMLIDAKIPEKIQMLFCGDGPLSDNLKTKGKVLGFVNPEKYLEKSGLVIAGGYLGTIEALSNKCLVIALCQTEIRKDIFKLTPFKNFIQIVDNNNGLEKVLYSFTKNPSIYKKQIKYGFEWAKKQTWKNVVKVYFDLWNK